MKRKTYLPGIFILLTITINLCAQVTIGSGIEPEAGCLLDLKEQESVTIGGVTSTKGLNLPRVRLTNLNDITKDISGVTTANADQHIGLMVYSVGVCDGIDEGVYVWDGDKWGALYSKVGSAIKNRQTDSLALVALYNSTNGTGWTNKTNWLSSQPIDTWYGITMTSLRDACGNKRINEIIMVSNNIIGQLPAELGNMTSLTNLTLNNNQLSGSIPAKLGNLTSLTTINLGTNNLTGAIPAELGDLANLTNLSLGANKLSGSIPPELGKLAKLTGFYAYGNQLSGAVPKELGDLVSFSFLNLGNNKLSGAIPPELGNLVNLTKLGLGYNKLTGTVPSALGNLSNLQRLSDPTLFGIAHNQLSGTLPLNLLNIANTKPQTVCPQYQSDGITVVADPWDDFTCRKNCCIPVLSHSDD